MRLAFVCGNTAECCLCSARFPLKTEEAARIKAVSHLQLVHARLMIDRQDKKKTKDGRQQVEYHGPRWVNNLVG